ncbi:hypothetical protein NT6N_04530 [Oceaniferula spumae]|uniref:Uncharacterized protein n=1 Tax=Oceaniferula spumae TaxID=2979115 RepID=A0AAT9FHH9_9BACT
MKYTHNTKPLHECATMHQQKAAQLANPLSFTQEGIDHAIDESKQLHNNLVPGNCRKDHVVAFCQQAPIARYMQFACAGGPERNPWDAQLARNFVRQLRASTLNMHEIIQLAYLRTFSGHGLPRLRKWLGLTRAERTDDTEFFLSMARNEAARLLVVGNFGTLLNQGNESDHRNSELLLLMSTSEFIKKIGPALESALSWQFFIPPHFVSLMAVAWREFDDFGRREMLERYREEILDEMAEHSFLRNMALCVTDDVTRDTWGVTHLEIIERTGPLGLHVLERCRVLDVEHSLAVPPMTKWYDLK